MPRSIKTFRQILNAVVVLTLAAPFAAPAASAAGGDGETVKPVAAHDLLNLARQAPHRGRCHLCAGRQVGAAPPRRQRLGLCAVGGEFRSQNSATGPARLYRAGRASRAAGQRSICSARTLARPSRQVCLPSTSPMTGRG